MAYKHKLGFIDFELDYLKKENLYRKLRYGKVTGSKIIIKNKTLLNLCSNDYLGISDTSIKQEQLQSSSRLVSGNDESYLELEKILAKHKSCQNSLVYPTGYMANMGVIPTITKKGDLILSDELNHASIIEACKLAEAKVSIFKHNDMKDLEMKIKQDGQNKFVISEGIFSMDGEFSKIKQIAEISQKFGAITIIDDAHGDFVVGKDGKGTPNQFGVSKKIDLYVSSLSKGLGSFGGYVASQNNVIDICTNKSKSFIYTSALPSFFVKHSLKRIKSNREGQRKKLVKNLKMLSEGLREIGFNIDSKTHIIPVIVGKEKTALQLGEFLLKNGIFAQPIRYPTVPKNSARLRISVTAWLSETEITRALEIFQKAYQKFW